MSAPAAAQEDRARLHFESGASYYEAGDYEDALREFERSYELSARPTLFYNFSLCHQQLGHFDVAADYLQRYLQEAEVVENRSNLERRLSNLRERADAAMANRARDTGDGSPAGEGAGGEAGGDGGGEPDGGLDVSPVVWVGAGVAGAGAVMLGVFGGLALAEKGDLDADPCSATRTCDASALRTRAVLADVGLGLLVVGAALGVTFLLLGGDDDDEERARLELTPSVGPDGATATLRGTF